VVPVMLRTKRLAMMDSSVRVAQSSRGKSERERISLSHL
jgi:hypothetical protein